MPCLGQRGMDTDFYFGSIFLADLKIFVWSCLPLSCVMSDSHSTCKYNQHWLMNLISMSVMWVLWHVSSMR